MPVPIRRERPAYRARWRPAPKAALSPASGSRTIQVSGRQAPARSAAPRASRLENLVSAGLDLPRLFAPAEAAEILRRLGLPEMTECALRTRAYRRQVPFHLNGRRVRFTTGDLREIAEGQARRPNPADAAPPPQARKQAPRRSPARSADHPPQTWRARRPPGTSAVDAERP
jgi:hypothetical protein